MSFVGNGRKATTSSSNRLMRNNSESARVKRSVIALCAIHAAPIVRKLMSIAEVGGPLVAQLFERRTRRMYGDFEHQQGGGDGEHAIAEGFHS